MFEKRRDARRTSRSASLLTVFPVKVTGGDCQEMLKLALLVGVKLVHAEPLLLPLDGMDTGAVA